MARYLPTVATRDPHNLPDTLQPGQWIDYAGARGRWHGRARGVVWIAWGATARRRFATFARVARAR